jgi:hypothetical protein
MIPNIKEAFFNIGLHTTKQKTPLLHDQLCCLLCNAKSYIQKNHPALSTYGVNLNWKMLNMILSNIPQ